jgi:ABC-type phosphate transport system permease subunit
MIAGGVTPAITAKKIMSSESREPEEASTAKKIMATAAVADATHTIFFVFGSTFGIFLYHFGDAASRIIRNTVAPKGIAR